MSHFDASSNLSCILDLKQFSRRRKLLKWNYKSVLLNTAFQIKWFYFKEIKALISTAMKEGMVVKREPNPVFAYFRIPVNSSESSIFVAERKCNLLVPYKSSVPIFHASAAPNEKRWECCFERRRRIKCMSAFESEIFFPESFKVQKKSFCTFLFVITEFSI